MDTKDYIEILQEIDKEIQSTSALIKALIEEAQK